MSELRSVVLLEGIKREHEAFVVMLQATRGLPSDGAIATTETPIVYSHYHDCRALIITLAVEVICIPTVTGCTIQEYACEVRSKAFLDGFDKEFNLSWI